MKENELKQVRYDISVIHLLLRSAVNPTPNPSSSSSSSSSTSSFGFLSSLTSHEELPNFDFSFLDPLIRIDWNEKDQINDCILKKLEDDEI
ncbi:hypothetical protein PanWU01x14_044810 [Parasponia andersonii]|uniref:Uncharacterized protein n=1 Tax=Parasponia andersonii TaxID=3476 RepID=A0A2P5DPC0_PARAD|nr:hypothetical protein PanWU01x14_044810 [Parasponia andersonii]